MYFNYYALYNNNLYSINSLKYRIKKSCIVNIN